MGKLIGGTYFTNREIKQFDKTINETEKDMSKEVKLSIISLAYADNLSAIDLQEAIDMLDIILHYKSSTNKKKGL